MSGGSETTTSKAFSAPLSPEGEEMSSYYSSIVDTYMTEVAGYRPVRTEKKKSKDEAKQKLLEIDIEKINADIVLIDEQLTQFANGPKSARSGPQVATLNKRKSDLLSKLKANESALADIGYTVYDEVKLEKIEDPRLTQALYEAAKKDGRGAEIDGLVSQYGWESKEVSDSLKQYTGNAEVASLRDSLRADELEAAGAKGDLAKNYVIALNKVLSGDVAATEKQKTEMAEYFAPVEGIIKKTTQDLLLAVGDNDADLRREIANVKTSIDQTGYDTFSALKAASIQIEKSGDNLLSVLEKTNRSAEAKAKFEFDLLSQQADEMAAKQSALLGLPPGSEQEKKRAMKIKTSALQSVILNLEQNKQQATLGIEQGVEQGKINISLAMAELAQSQGAKNEAAARLGFDVTANTGQMKLNLLGAEGQQLTALEQQKQDALFGVAYGNLANAAEAAQGGLGFDMSKTAQQGQVFQAGNAQVGLPLGIEQNRTLAEATNTSKTKTSLGFFDVAEGISGMVGAAISAMA